MHPAYPILHIVLIVGLLLTALSVSAGERPAAASRDLPLAMLPE
jgi:hypothetical protein